MAMVDFSLEEKDAQNVVNALKHYADLIRYFDEQLGRKKGDGTLENSSTCKELWMNAWRIEDQLKRKKKAGTILINGNLFIKKESIIPLSIRSASAIAYDLTKRGLMVVRVSDCETEVYVKYEITDDPNNRKVDDSDADGKIVEWSASDSV